MTLKEYEIPQNRASVNILERQGKPNGRHAVLKMNITQTFERGKICQIVTY